MRCDEDELTELSRARLDYLAAGREPLGSRPRHVREEVPLMPPAEESWLRDASLVEELVEPKDGSSDGMSRPAGFAYALRAARGFSRAHLQALVALALVVVLATGAYLMRAKATSMPIQQLSAAAPPVGGSGSAEQPPVPGRPGSSPSPGGGSTTGYSAPAAAGAGASIQVHVLGAVKRPGVVRLTTGQRVVDAILATGGLVEGASTGELNLAAPLADGDQVVVARSSGRASEVRHAGGAASGSESTAAPSGGGAGATGAQLDLNSATAEQLDQLPGVGPVTAQRIIDWRKQHGRFSKVAELQEVDGIGPKTFAQLSSHVTV